MEYTGPQCPATCGKDTSMTISAFEVRCLQHQTRHILLCRECAGSMPPAELTIVEETVRKPTKMDKPKKEQFGRMTKVKINGEKEKCEFCGEMRTVKEHKGRRICTTCQYIRTGASKRPSVLLAALLEIYSADEMREMFDDIQQETA